MLRHFTLLISAMILSLVAYSQSGLKFKQVRIIRNSTTTVPADHVWKVEAFWNSGVRLTNSYNVSTCDNDEDWHASFYVNSYYYFTFNGIATGNSTAYATANNQFPFWLSAGNTMKTVCPGDFLSVLEFEVIP